jgi:2-polyprenyl-3-methyl-5-hydroxy-6-metoxy-1,4-benzoquinol methylase
MTVCPLCGTQAARKLQVPHTVVWECHADSCRLRFASPQLSSQELARAYATYYYPAANDGDSARYEDTPDLVVKQVLSQLESSPGKLRGLRLLDYGCGRGPFSAVALEFGLAPNGIEPDPVARKDAAARLGIVVYTNLDELRSEVSTLQFDLIILWNVIEHLRQPWLDLQGLRALLRPGGKLLIGTMNAKCLRSRIERSRWLHYRNPTHFYYVDRISLGRILARAGFSQVAEWKPKLRYPQHGVIRRWIYQASSLLGLADGLYYLCSTRGTAPRF